MTTERRCGSCRRPMRHPSVLAADAPGTVQEGARGLCNTCQHYPPGHTPQVPMDWLSQECEDCGRGLRPPRSRAADHPGRVRPARKGLCEKCRDKRAELTAPPCKVDGCEMKARHRRGGMCDRHYMQDYNARRSAGPTPKPAPASCSVEGCDVAARSRGMCNTHYRRAWRAEKRAVLPQCAVEGCERVIRAEGLCASHYSAQERERKRAQERDKKQRAAAPQHEVTDPGLLRFYARRNTRLNSRTQPKIRRTAI